MESISLIRFARASSQVTDFNTGNKLLTQILLKQGYRYHKLRKTFLDFIDDTMILCLNFKLDLISLAPRTFGTRVIW